MKLNDLLSAFGFNSCIIDLTVLTKKIKGSLVILVVYMDDILQIGIDDTIIHTTKTYLKQHLIIRDLGSARYFFGIEFAHEDGKLALS